MIFLTCNHLKNLIYINATREKERASDQSVREASTWRWDDWMNGWFNRTPEDAHLQTVMVANTEQSRCGKFNSCNYRLLPSSPFAWAFDKLNGKGSNVTGRNCNLDSFQIIRATNVSFWGNSCSDVIHTSSSTYVVFLHARESSDRTCDWYKGCGKSELDIVQFFSV